MTKIKTILLSCLFSIGFGSICHAQVESNVSIRRFRHCKSRLMRVPALWATAASPRPQMSIQCIGMQLNTLFRKTISALAWLIHLG